MKLANRINAIPVAIRILIFGIHFAICGFCSAQSPDSLFNLIGQPGDSSPIVIGEIVLIGNKITKEHIITRELTFKRGDTIPFADFEKQRTRSEENIYNTSLFNSAHISLLKIKDGTTSVYIFLKERWYIFPVPIFEIIDRNFNVWWETKDLSRIVYGGTLTWNNFRGRNETIGVTARFGYTQNFSFLYSIPYINSRQRSGLTFRFATARNHQTNYATLFNEPVYYKDIDGFSIRSLGGSAEYAYRKGLYVRHYVSAAYLSAETEDTIQALNPDFFGGHRSTEKYTSLRYFFKSEHRDLVAYPLKGYEYDVEVVKNGLAFLNDDVDFSYLVINYRGYWQLKKRWYFAAGARGKIADQNFQPYFNTRALGYGTNYVRGYEYYVVDGQRFVLFKSNLKFELFSRHTLHTKFIPLEKFATIPFAFYMNLYGDAAYAEDKQFARTNTLTNSWLYGYGAGIDFVTYYDIVLRFEYSFNKMGESGFFLHVSAPI